MALLFASASSQRLEAASAVVTAKPISLACWYKPTTSNAAAGLLSLLASGTANRIFQLGHTSSGVPFVNERGSTGAVGAAASALTNGSWAHIAGTLVSGTAGARTAYLNGTAGTPATGSVATPPVPDRTAIGGDTPTVAGTYADFANGVIAEAAIWNVVLTAAEVAMLAAGARPFQVRPGSLAFYAPLLSSGASPEIDIRGGMSLAWTNSPAPAPHPPTLGQAGKLWIPTFPTQIVSLALGGTLAAASSLTGALTDSAILAGAIASTSSLTGAASAAAALTGTLAAGSTLAGAATVAGIVNLTGVVTAASSLAGTLADRTTLAGTVTAHSTLVATISAVTTVAGTIPGHSTITAEITVIHNDVIELAGWLDSTSSLQATLSPLTPPTRYAIHWFWEPCNKADDTQPPVPDTCPGCGSKVVLLTRDREVITRHYQAGTVKQDGSTAAADCPYIATITPGNYAQPLPADITAGYVTPAQAP